MNIRTQVPAALLSERLGGSPTASPVQQKGLQPTNATLEFSHPKEDSVLKMPFHKLSLSPHCGM